MEPLYRSLKLWSVYISPPVWDGRALRQATLVFPHDPSAGCLSCWSLAISLWWSFTDRHLLYS